MTGKEIAVKEKSELAEPGKDQFSTALSVNPAYVEQTKRSLALLQQLVSDVLVQGRDFGRVPGIPDEFLWDPGAAQIIGAFNCHPGPVRILSLVDTDEKISAIVEVPLLNFQSGNEVGCGQGAASTNEVKHKYRWVKEQDLEEWGYTGEAVKQLKTKKDKWGDKYRVPNPERSELLNTIIKIAAKRARVGAAQQLPGVSSLLRAKFGKKRPEGEDEEPKTDWDRFYARAKGELGLSYEEIHTMLGVKSLKDYVAMGFTLDQAYDELVKMQTKANPLETGLTPPTKIHNENPITANQSKELIDMLGPAGMTLKDLGERIRKDFKWQGIEKLSMLKVWQYDELKVYLNKAAGLA